MAIPPNQSPLLVKDTTATDGSGVALTLDNAAVGNGYRTFVEAFTDGDLSSGDTVTVAIVDSTVGWGGVMFELRECVWTNSGGGGSLSAGTTLQPNGTPPTWPASGTRDVLLITDPLSRLANLADLDNLTTARSNLEVAQLDSSDHLLVPAGGRIYIGTGISIAEHVTSRGFTLRQEGSGDHLLSLLRTDNAAGSVAAAIVRGEALNSAAGSYETSRIQFHQVDPTATSEDGQIRFFTMQAGTLTELARMDQNGGFTAQPSGDAFDHFPGGGVTKMLFGSAIPAGWTRVDEVTAGRSIRLCQSGDTVGATGGTLNPYAASNWSTVGHVLTIAEMPSHNHQYRSGAGGGSDAPTLDTGAPIASGGTTVKPEGGGAAHAHEIQPLLYRFAAWATKD